MFAAYALRRFKILLIVFVGRLDSSSCQEIGQMSEKPIEMCVQVMPWDDLIDAIKAVPEVDDQPDAVWLALDEGMKQVSIAKN